MTTDTAALAASLDEAMEQATSTLSAAQVRRAELQAQLDRALTTGDLTGVEGVHEQIRLADGAITDARTWIDQLTARKAENQRAIDRAELERQWQELHEQQAQAVARGKALAAEANAAALALSAALSQGEQVERAISANQGRIGMLQAELDGTHHAPKVVIPPAAFNHDVSAANVLSIQRSHAQSTSWLVQITRRQEG